IQIAKENEFDLKIVQSVVEVNTRQRTLMMEKIQEAVGDLKGKRLAFLGLAFKPNTDDIRESAAVDIIRMALARGAVIRAFDPEAMPESRKVLPDIEYGGDPYEAARGAEAVILVTEWNQFRNLDLKKLKDEVSKPVFIDLRNVYDGEMMAHAGFRHVGVGRPPRME
ncbi:MAG TPA: UDP binding domain-containing protein, partial [Nitrospiria bacterium]|nr:UDP binding domain-containing protein [Nitrospiria bacterium]